MKQMHFTVAVQYRIAFHIHLYEKIHKKQFETKKHWQMDNKKITITQTKSVLAIRRKICTQKTITPFQAISCP